MTVNLNNFFDRNEYTILLLGENGAGKSTWINSIGNYLKFANFDQVKPHLVKQLIPCKFKWFNPETLIESGKDENEVCTEDSLSTTTLQPRCYAFICENRTIRFIDTPGLIHSGKNTDKLVSYLRNFTKLHGICFVIKNNNEQELTNLKNIISEILRILHNDARRNIAFCFTHSRHSSFEPNNKFLPLKYFLKSVEIELIENQNCFFVDNEAYHYFIAQKFNYSLNDEQIERVRKSWNKSSVAIQKMIDYFAIQAAYLLDFITQLHQSRHTLGQLEEFAKQVLFNFEKNLEQIDQKLKIAIEDKMRLSQNLYLEVYDLEQRPLAYPHTVCTAEKCIELIDYNGQKKINYKTHCHAECHCMHMHMAVNTIGHSAIKGCAAMKNGICTHCGCDWQKHMHVIIEYVIVKRTITDQNIEMEIKKVVNDIGELEKQKLLEQGSVNEYTEFLKICSQLSLVVNKNSIMKINEFIDEKLKFTRNDSNLPYKFEDIPEIIKSLTSTKLLKPKYELIEKSYLNNNSGRFVVFSIKLDLERLQLKIDCLNELNLANNQNVTEEHKAILSKLIETNSLIVESDGKVDLSGATLEKVIFSSGKSSITTGNVIFEPSFDGWIKANFLQLFPLIKDKIPEKIQIKEIVEHEVYRQNLHEKYQKATQMVDDQFNSIGVINEGVEIENVDNPLSTSAVFTKQFLCNSETIPSQIPIETDRNEVEAQKSIPNVDNPLSTSVVIEEQVFPERNPIPSQIPIKTDRIEVEPQKSILNVDNPLSTSAVIEEQVFPELNPTPSQIPIDRNEVDTQIFIQSADNLIEPTIKSEYDSRETNDESQKLIEIVDDKIQDNFNVIIHPPEESFFTFSIKPLVLVLCVVSVLVLIVRFLFYY